MIEVKGNYVAHKRNTIINQIKKDLGNNEPSVNDVIDYLLEDQVYSLREYDDTNRTLLNRFNMLWVYPIFILTMPFQWLILGQVGVKRESKLGQLVEKLIKYI